MKFEKAVQAMKDGKKVRRRTYTGLKLYDLKQIVFCWEDINSVDWEIVEETKTLSDKREKIGDCEYGYSEWNVKEALKEILRYCNEDVLIQKSGKFIVGNIMNKIKKEFGERLIK